MIARTRVLRVIGGCSVALALSTGAGTNRVAAQTYCDPNYATTYAGCVPGDRDYDCPELHAMGIGDIPVVGSDWQRLDGYYDYYQGYWVSYPDGLGCEWYGE
jgi:hypothetical protein